MARKPRIYYPGALYHVMFRLQGTLLTNLQTPNSE
jgi:hypothetical protein